MDSIARRFAAGSLAFTWLILSLLVPVSAHAATYNAASNLTGRQWAVPAQGTGIAGSPIVATAATMLGRANPWIAAITLGTPVMQYLVEKHGGDKLAIRAKDAPVATPAGWTTNPNGIPSPPATASATGGATQAPTTTLEPKTFGYGQSYTTVSGNNTLYPVKYFSSRAAACAYITPGVVADYPSAYLANTYNDACNYAYAPSAGAQPKGVSTTGYYCPDGTTVSGTQCLTPSCPSGFTLTAGQCVQAATCPTGYAMSQGYCTIVDPGAVKWPADSIPTYIPNDAGTGFIPDPRDPDPIPSTPTPTEIQNSPNDYTKDQYGNPTSTSISPQPGGGYKIDQRVQTTNNNQTTTTINNITINNAGNVTNISSTTVPGPIDLASPAAAPAAQKIEFPTDYNRENTQLAVKSKLDEIQAGTGAADSPNYDVAAKAQAMNDGIKEKIDAIPGQYAGDKGTWFSWVWTPQIGVCEPWVNTIHGQTVTWDVCPYVAKVRDVMAYILAVLSAIAVYGQLFKRED